MSHADVLAKCTRPSVLRSSPSPLTRVTRGVALGQIDRWFPGVAEPLARTTAAAWAAFE
jgi:hypothetical protein